MTPEEQRRVNQERGVAGLPTGSDAGSVATRKAFRQKVAANEQAAEAAARSGAYATVDDYLRSIGKTGTKEGGGMRLKNLYGEGGLYSTYGGGADPNYIYDWEGGRKYNIATSDMGNQVWQPITDAERASYAGAVGDRGDSYWAQLGRQGGGGGGGFTPMNPSVPSYSGSGIGDPVGPTQVKETAAVPPPGYGQPGLDLGGMGGVRSSGIGGMGTSGQRQRKGMMGGISTRSGSYVPGIGGM